MNRIKLQFLLFMRVANYRDLCPENLLPHSSKRPMGCCHHPAVWTPKIECDLGVSNSEHLLKISLITYSVRAASL